MPLPGKPWRVRVKRVVEDWVEVRAVDSAAAECLAGQVPGVLSVFGMSAIPADKLAGEELPIGVQEELFGRS